VKKKRRGTEFEIWLLKELQSRFGRYDREKRETKVRASINSGAIFGDNDLALLSIAGKDWQIECKSTEKRANFIVQKADWDHLVDQANSHLREPLLFTRNKDHDVIVSMDALLLLELLQELEKRDRGGNLNGQ